MLVAINRLIAEYLSLDEDLLEFVCMLIAIVFVITQLNSIICFFLFLFICLSGCWNDLMMS
jgi:hypothetical protein